LFWVCEIVGSYDQNPDFDNYDFAFASLLKHAMSQNYSIGQFFVYILKCLINKNTICLSVNSV